MTNKDVRCNIKLFKQPVREITGAVSETLVKTAEAIHTELVQSQTMPFVTGNLQNESTFVDDFAADVGKVYLVSSTPYARRLYYHPEYHFDKSENPSAGGKWLAPYLPGGAKESFAQNAFNKLYRQEAGL